MSPRSKRPIIQFVGNLAKVAIPLALIAAAALWVLNRESTQVGELRVITRDLLVKLGRTSFVWTMQKA